MTSQKVDQLDLFKKPVFEVREKGGSLDLEQFRLRVKAGMSRAIRESRRSRQTIALKMAHYLGIERLSADTINAYTCRTKDRPIDIVMFAAFVRATEAPWLWDLILSQDGLTILEGEEPRLAEIARLEQERKGINAELRKLRAKPVQVKDWRKTE